jgi:hypothetical protein
MQTGLTTTKACRLTLHEVLFVMYEVCVHPVSMSMTDVQAAAIALERTCGIELLRRMPNKPGGCE